ncbi:MAG: hypothetical protein WCD20_15955 [Rhodomicrobium sp.]
MDPIPNGSNVSLCPADKMIANQSRFDLSRGYIPVLLATALFAGGFGLAVRGGGWLETFKQERSTVLSRLDRIEVKLDSVVAWVDGPQRSGRSR